MDKFSRIEHLSEFLLQKGWWESCMYHMLSPSLTRAYNFKAGVLHSKTWAWKEKNDLVGLVSIMI